MCGIVALWDPFVAAAARHALAVDLASTLVHRGPDGSGAWTAPDAPLAVAHRRLAIRGLGDQGAQPMFGRYGTLAFNGELFGIEPLRQELAARGARFRGTSDTEVLLHALDEWGGRETLARISGQFAFVWWDERDRRLFLARDRVGIRPLYYAQEGARLVVASEQKAILPLPWVDDTVLPAATLRYLILGRTDDIGGETMVRGVRMLPAAHFAEWDGRTLTLERYFRFSDRPPAATVADVRRELERAVDEQLVSDVPLGAMISGGLDSSAVSLLADRARLSRHDERPLHLFCYADLGAEEDEQPFQRAVLAGLGSAHQVHWVSSTPATFVKRFHDYIHHQEAPYADVSSFAELSIAEEAQRRGVKVLLSGLGGDEVFAGYRTFFGPLFLDLVAAGDLGAVLELLAAAPAVAGRPEAYALPIIAAGAYHALPSGLRNLLTAVRSASTGHLPPQQIGLVAVDAWKRWHPHDGSGHTNAALRGAIESWCLPRFLAHSDRMCLAYGVETRVPILDERVVAAAFGIPAAGRVGRSGLKRALREALGDVLPVAVRERAWKLGFHVPLAPYVAAADEPLRAGYEVARAALGAAPPWERLEAAGRWSWGNLGAYLAWVRARRVAGVPPAIDHSRTNGGVAPPATSH
jgi:asparagine synthase (glutamine-hydrolysing)